MNLKIRTQRLSMFIADLLLQDHHQKQQYSLVRKKEPHFGLAVQHLDLVTVHLYWPTKRNSKSGETSLRGQRETYEAKGVESVIAKDHES